MVLNKIVDYIFEVVNSSSIITLVGLYISAAFDMVNDDILLVQLQSEFDIFDIPHCIIPFW